MREIAAFMVTMVVGVVGFLFAIIWLANTLAFPGQLAKIDQLRLDAAHVDPIQAEATIGQVTLWNQMICSITGVAASCSLYSHGAGWPISANAAPLIASATPPTANPSNRRPIWLLDIFMPFALPSKSSPKGNLADRENAVTIRPRRTA